MREAIMAGTSSDMDQSRLSQTDYFNAQFVPQILSALVNDGRHEGKPPIGPVLDLLVGCMLSGDRGALARLTAECRRLHIPSEVVVDTYLPAAVDRIGARWHDDEIDILTATIAFARMQTLMRDLGRNWHADDMTGSSGAVLMLVPETDQHTLGALIATGQLKRRGISVTIKLTSSPLDLDATLAKARFDAIFVSVGNVSSLESAAKLIKIAKRPGNTALPVIVGGSVPVAPSKVQQVTGADHVARDVASALGFLGLGDALRVTR